MTEKNIDYFRSKELEIEKVKIIYGRNELSMKILDKLHRKYVNMHKFTTNEIVAIKSVAGSGKTTTLLKLSKIHKKKRILYLAFNKSLILDIKTKLRKQKITNMYPKTFDSLMRNIYITNKDIEPNITYLKPQTISQIVPWFDRKPYNIKKYYCNHFAKFCQQTEFNDIEKYCLNKFQCKKPLLAQLWEKVLSNKLVTFDSIRKLGQINHWSKNYIDKKFDMIFIDEAQDFDNIMLSILLEDTTIPKLFVGDTRQAIYEWRGCINAFDKLPDGTLFIEFYSTFRIGEPACKKIRDKFEDCWMISNNDNKTVLEYNVEPSENYTYLFRSWKSLLTTAKNTKNIWIYGYDKQIEFIKRLHNKLQFSKLSVNELNEFSDDLPAFLLKLSKEELEDLLSSIENNIVDKKTSIVKMYTIHSYKGLEDDIIRIYNDIDIMNEENIYYVALTRGMKQIILDEEIIDDEEIPNKITNEMTMEIIKLQIQEKNNKLLNLIMEKVKKDKPENHGKSWTPESNNIFSEMISQNYSFTEIGDKLKRTSGSIRSRVKMLLLKNSVKHNKDLIKIKEYFNIEDDDNKTLNYIKKIYMKI